jgi:protein-S-isoprenylcysteine O-methyltransferase Ste14
MYLAVVAVILGQGLLLGDVRVLEYGVLVCLGFHLFVLFSEEPTLCRSFGAEYENFCTNVGCWIPQLERMARWLACSRPISYSA